MLLLFNCKSTLTQKIKVLFKPKLMLMLIRRKRESEFTEHAPGAKTKLGLEKTQMHVLKNIEMFYGRWIRTFMKIVYKEFLMVVSLHWMKSKSS